MEAATGVQRDSYTVAITTSVHRQVKHGAGVTEGVFAADLDLRLDSLELHVASPGGDALAPSQGALVSVPLDRANHLELLGQGLSIALLRALALAGLCLLAAVWAEALLRTTRGDEASAIERRYRSYLVPVRTTGTAATPIHEVESIATLARLADHAGAPVLQSEDGVYQVIDGPRVYRYTAEPVETRP